MREARRPGVPDGPPRVPGVAVAAALGALWGTFGYAALWGHTPLVVTPRFAFSAVGTVVLLPVRIVLRAIRFVEEQVAHRQFDLSSNNWWIGLVAGALGAAIAAAAFLALRWAVRRLRPRGAPAG